MDTLIYLEHEQSTFTTFKPRGRRLTQSHWGWNGICVNFVVHDDNDNEYDNLYPTVTGIILLTANDGLHSIPAVNYLFYFINLFIFFGCCIYKNCCKLAHNISTQ